MAFGDIRIPRRVWSKITVDADGHWWWNGAFAGQPQTRRTLAFKVHKVVNVRRWLYETEYGSQDAEVVAGCAKRCVNPEHAMATSLSAWSLHVHAERLSPTHCARGHEIAITGWLPARNGKGETWRCRECAVEASRRHIAERRMKEIRRLPPARRKQRMKRLAAGRKGWRTRRISSEGEHGHD